MELISGKTFTRKLPRNFNESDRGLFEHERSITLPGLEIQRFNNVVVLPEQLIYRNGKRIVTIKTNADDLSLFNKTIAFIRRKTINIQEAVYLTDTWSNNYFHWFTDVLPRLFIAEKQFENHVFLIPSKFKAFEYITASLQAFDKTTIVWLHNYQKAKVKELVYIPITAPTGNYNEEILNELSQKLRKFFKLDLIEPFKKIMISREKAVNRKIINHKEIINLLQNNDVQEVVFEELTWHEQIKIAAESSALIGTHGAGLTNMLFMKANAIIVELRRANDSHNNCYFSMASALNMNYYYVLNDVDDIKKTTQQNNFIIDSKSLTRALQSGSTT